MHSSEPLVFPGDVTDDGQIHLDTPRRAVQALCLAQFKGQRVDVEVRARKSKRSVQANAAFHAEAMHYAAAKGQIGAAAIAFVEQFKDDLLGLLWGYHVRQNQYTGQVLTTLVEPHTSALTVAQFHELHELAMVKAAEDGYVWRAPDEYREAKARQAKPRQQQRVQHDERVCRIVERRRRQP